MSTSNSSQLNCSALWLSPPPLTPNPDVSGMGVLIGFMATAFATWILLVFHYVVIYDPEIASLSRDANEDPNPVDQILLKSLSSKFNRPSKTWEAGVEKLVLMLSDQQMITGIALLVSGYSRLPYGISAFHWQILAYLVWYSSFTHLATLTVLRRYLRDNSPMRWWRLLLMFLVLIGLCAALVPTGGSLWFDVSSDMDFSEPGMPAICFFSFPTGAANWQVSSMIISIFILIISYITRAIKLFQWTSRKARRWLRTVPGDKFKSVMDILHSGMEIESQQIWIISLPYWVLFCFYATAKACFDLVESMLLEITWLLMALIWGTIRLFLTRQLTVEDDDPGISISTISVESGWEFGQSLPVAMLSLTLFAAIEVYYETNQRIELTANSDASSFSNQEADDENISSSSTKEGISEQNRSAKLLPPNETDMIVRASQRLSSSISLEELDIGLIDQPQSADNESRIGLEDVRVCEVHPESEGQAVAPHRQVLHQHRWFGFLTGLLFIQALSLSIYVLTAANGVIFPFMYSAELTVDIPPNSPISLLLDAFNWITLYVPGNAVMYVACVLFLQSAAKTKWYNSRFPRPHTQAYTRAVDGCKVALTVLALCLNLSILFVGLPIAIWEGFLPLGAFMMMYVAGAFLSIGIPWYIVLRHKLRRLGRRLS